MYPKLAHECVLELLKLSSNVNECKPLARGTWDFDITGSSGASTEVGGGGGRQAGTYPRPLFGSM